eukprot:TRINITY_DN619_c0_g1_i14.p1 TRINITY_DN619_c0_g1~~TRINITY_DN619_c0_g1_i14.p1  ORF type:complete len:133 (-),score=32.04 TRINITY_DN619_c0_g1_i14:93-440(-)
MQRQINMTTEDWTGPDLDPDWNRFGELASGPSASSLKKYLESGGSPETRYFCRWTLLGYALYKDEKEHVKLLLEYKANPNLLVIYFIHFFFHVKNILCFVCSSSGCVPMCSFSKK